MERKTILTIIGLVVLGSLVSYGTLQYLQYRDEQAFKKMEETKQQTKSQPQELTRIERLEQMAPKEELTHEEIKKRQEALDSQAPKTLTPVNDAERIKRLESLMKQ